jgi:hypothetical protein
VAAGKEHLRSGKAEALKRGGKGQQKYIEPRINSHCKIFRVLNGRSGRTQLWKAQKFVEDGLII